MNFADRISVLTTARTFEDTGVSAYNGAGQLLVDPKHLTTTRPPAVPSAKEWKASSRKALR
ncbi:MAG: ferritin-like domain-containing protein [Bradyrhizobium sp.]|nr:ferritin-like domain-containing protein [Bradyrhizobium sp.]